MFSSNEKCDTIEIAKKSMDKEVKRETHGWKITQGKTEISFNQ
jgi:hypothetical protein